MTFREVVDILGEPTYVEANPWGIECLGCSFNLNWDNIQLSIGVLDKRCSAGWEICKAIWDGNPIPGDFIVDYVNYYNHSWIGFNTKEEINWPGFE